jgi:nucleotide-binding universal stress UspA family protein
MKRILCPTDFSEAAANAVEYAAELAQKMSAGITLINVRMLSDLTPEEQILYKKDRDVQTSRDRLEELSEMVNKSFKVPCGFMVETSVRSLSGVIGSNALGYDLIVMGTKGTSSIGQLLFGTNTYNVIREANVPVLLVPEGCRYQEVKLIVFAFDYWRTNQLPLSKLIELVRILHSEILILEVMEESKSQKIEKQLEEDQKQIKQLYADENVSIRFDTIHTSDLSTSINNYILRNQAGLLALCAIRHSLIETLFHKSVIEDISGMASYPVFIFQ